MRAATTPAAVELKAEIDKMFNLDGWEKSRWAYYFDKRKRLLRWRGVYPESEFDSWLQDAINGMELFQ